MAINRNVPDASDYYDEEEEAPKKRRRYEDEDDDRPEKVRRNYDDEDEDDEDERPAKKRRSRDYDDEDEDRPAKKSRRRDDDDEGERPSRRSRRRDDDDDEEDEDPDELPARSSVIQRGWAAARKAASEASDFTDDFKFEEDEQIVKFLDVEPVTYQQHWLDQKSGKKSYVCVGDGCPLCEELGDSPSSRFAFSIVNLTAEGNPVQILPVGVRLGNLLDKYNSDQRKGPLDKHFWSLSKVGERRNTQHKVHLVKERDLADDYDLDPEEVDAVLAKRKPLDMSKAIVQTPIRELREIADELL